MCPQIFDPFTDHIAALHEAGRPAMSSSVPPIKWTEGQERQLMASVCELHDVHIKKRDEVAICRVMRVPSHKICAIKYVVPMLEGTLQTPYLLSEDVASSS